MIRQSLLDKGMKVFLNKGLFLVRLNKSNNRRLFVKNIKNITFIVGGMVFVVAMIGFLITLDASPQIAYARLFIDVGLIIALSAAIMAFNKETVLPIGNIIHALNSLKQKKYQTRISEDGLGQLAEVAMVINELAKNLEEEHKKQEQIKKELREELLPGYSKPETVIPQHSYHPELGPVLPITTDLDLLVEVKADSILPKENILNNPLTDSLPPSNLLSTDTIVPLAPLEQDLGELYQNFIDAQIELSLQQTEYQTFLATIDEVKNNLKASHNCKEVLFEVVRNAQDVALQPRLVK